MTVACRALLDFNARDVWTRSGAQERAQINTGHLGSGRLEPIRRRCYRSFCVYGGKTCSFCFPSRKTVKVRVQFLGFLTDVVKNKLVKSCFLPLSGIWCTVSFPPGPKEVILASTRTWDRHKFHFIKKNQNDIKSPRISYPFKPLYESNTGG